MEHEQLIRQVAREVGVPEHIALAFAQAESNGMMVYGHDIGGLYSTRDEPVTIAGVTWPKGSDIPVTADNYATFEAAVAMGAKSNGVGIMQITYRGFLTDARAKGLDLADAADNVRYGLTLIRGSLAAAPEGLVPLTYAASRDNKGTVFTGPYHYTDRVNAYASAWAAKEAPMAPTVHPRSAWTTVPPKGITKVSWPSIKVVNIHWPASKGRAARDKAGIAAALRGWQRDHMNPKPKGRGWRDIAYNVAVDLNGDVWELRGWDVQDGGVADRSDDVTILLIMGKDDKMTDQMKAGVLWCMREFEARKGGPLRRTHHGALQSTDCPGPEATAWSKAGFPAPATTTTPTEEPEMITPEDRTAIATDVLWTLVGFRPDGARNLWDNAIESLRQSFALRAEVAGLTTALETAESGPVDVDAVRAAVADVLAEHTQSMADVVAGLATTVDGLSDRLDAEARDALAAALDRARQAVTA